MARLATHTSAVEDVSYKQRKLPREAQGAYAFGLFEERRAPRFLNRNIKQIQDFHHKQCQMPKIGSGQVSNDASSLAHLEAVAADSATLAALSALVRFKKSRSIVRSSSSSSSP